ncbi:MAG: GDYXXLXY domain-containing protein [Chloroflexi bacterium]|nr:GDYXXLXY domain-containing protein [Chloroflexota bacterium]
MKIAFWATVAGQIILLLAFIGVKENTLRTGTSVLLQTVPVDPRSLLQGDYVTLDYEIAELPQSLREAPIGETVYVSLRKTGGELWVSQGHSILRPEKGVVFIKGTVNDRGRLDLGLGTYFIPEGTGSIIERAQDVKVRASVNSSGSAVIQELLVDGEPFDPNRPQDLPLKEPPPRPAEPAKPPE